MAGIYRLAEVGRVFFVAARDSFVCEGKSKC
jgi:hypothetical protein